MIKWEWLTCIKQKFKQCFFFLAFYRLPPPPHPPQRGGLVLGASIVKILFLWRQLIATDKKKIVRHIVARCSCRRQTSIKKRHPISPNPGRMETGKIIWKCGAFLGMKSPPSSHRLGLEPWKIKITFRPALIGFRNCNSLENYLFFSWAFSI